MNRRFRNRRYRVEQRQGNARAASGEWPKVLPSWWCLRAACPSLAHRTRLNNDVKFKRRERGYRGGRGQHPSGVSHVRLAPVPSFPPVVSEGGGNRKAHNGSADHRERRELDAICEPVKAVSTPLNIGGVAVLTSPFFFDVSLLTLASSPVPLWLRFASGTGSISL